MRQVRRSLLLATALCISVTAAAKDLIPYESFTLPNGLEVIVHEDRKAPIVAIQVAYRVGSRDEPQGKTGFAHLFEHLLFKGTENFHGDFFATLDEAGASGTNAITTYDTTTYFETVPTPALELALWLESERMGHFRTAITQQVLDAERSVVQNEKREREAGATGLQDALLLEGLFPQGHPYRRTVMGDLDDLNAASVEDLRRWFTQFYGASNAIVVLSGDIDTETARNLAGKYFGDAPPGEPVHRMTDWVPERMANTHEVMQARIPQTSLQRAWVIPGSQTRDYVLLSIAASVLSDAIQSRLRERLVKQSGLATAIGSYVQGFALASVFTVAVDVKTGVDVAEVEMALDTELAQFLEEGPTANELQRSKSGLDAIQLWGLQSVTDKASVLARAAALSGDPGANERSLKWARQALRPDVRRACRQWLARGYFQLTTTPFVELKSVASAIDRKIMPVVKDALVLDLPPMQEATLSNGMKVVLAERHQVPALNMTLVFDRAGRSADQGGKTGQSVTTFTLMRNGPMGLSQAQYSTRLQELHASIGMAAAVRDATSSLVVLKKNLPEALRLWRMVLREPAFRADDLEHWRESLRQGIEDASASPDAVGSQIMAAALFPPGHPYATPWNSDELIDALQRRDAVDFHATWVRPDIGKLFVVGDITLPELKRALEAAFAGWGAPAKPKPTAPDIPVAMVPAQPRFILLDWPGEQQTRIFAGRLVPGAKHEDARLLVAANDLLGGGTTSRLGQRIRVDKGWTYGIASALDGNLAQQYWGLSTLVQADKTVEAVVQILDVIDDFRDQHPATPEELERFVKGVTRSVPGSFEDAGAVLAAMVQSDAYGHPYDWAEGTKRRLDALKIEEVNRVARDYFTPQSLTWVLVGDVATFEQKLRNLGIGTVGVWDRERHQTRLLR